MLGSIPFATGLGGDESPDKSGENPPRSKSPWLQCQLRWVHSHYFL